MDKNENEFKAWLAVNHPNVHFLQNESITIEGVHFFGGTMWTDFNGGDTDAMIRAANAMNDFRHIMLPNGQLLNPIDTLAFHKGAIPVSGLMFSDFIPVFQLG